MAVLDPDELFEQAEFLVASRRPGPPRQVDVRRAVSAAYYAVFHFICTEAADFVIGQRYQREARYAQVYRSVDHRDIRSACAAVQAAKPDVAVARLAPSNGFAARLQEFAAGTIELQVRRHTADYDPSGLLRTKHAHLMVSLGRSTISAFRDTDADNRAAFLTIILFKRR